jgi:hypothetical protein
MGKWVTIKPQASFLDITCVQARDDFVRALELGGIDLIISDFDVPASDGLAAAEIVRTKCRYLLSSFPVHLRKN